MDPPSLNPNDDNPDLGQPRADNSGLAEVSLQLGLPDTDSSRPVQPDNISILSLADTDVTQPVQRRDKYPHPNDSSSDTSLLDFYATQFIQFEDLGQQNTDQPGIDTTRLADSDITQPVQPHDKHPNPDQVTSEPTNTDDGSDVSLLDFFATQLYQFEDLGQPDTGQPDSATSHPVQPVYNSDSLRSGSGSILPTQRHVHFGQDQPGLHRRLTAVPKADDSDISLTASATSLPVPYHDDDPDSDQQDQQSYTDDSDSNSYESGSEDTSPSFLGQAIAYIGSYWPSWLAPPPEPIELELVEIQKMETRIEIEEGEEPPTEEPEAPIPETREERNQRIREQFGTFAPYPESSEVHIEGLKEKPAKKVRIKKKKDLPKLYYHYRDPLRSNFRYATTEKPLEETKTNKVKTDRGFFPRNKWKNLPEPRSIIRSSAQVPLELQSVLSEGKVENLKRSKGESGKNEEKNLLLEEVFRKIAAKSALMDNHGLYVGVFRELKEKANEECVEKGKSMVKELKGPALKDFDYNFNPIHVIIDDSISPTKATLLEYPEIQRSYIILPGMTPQDTELHWHMIFERKTSVVVQLSEQDYKGFQYLPLATKTFIKFGKYTVYCLTAKQEYDYIVRELAILKDVDESEIEESHKLIHFQFLGWKNPAPVHEMFSRFHTVLRVNNLLSETPVIISSTGLGRAGAFVITEAVLTMLDQNVHSSYCIETMIHQLATTRRNGIHYVYQYKFIYDHLVQMMEMETPELRRIGIDCRDYAESTTPMESLHKNTITKFLSSEDWGYNKDEIEKFGNEASLLRRSDQVVAYQTLINYWWTQLWGPLDEQELMLDIVHEEIRQIEQMKEGPDCDPDGDGDQQSAPKLAEPVASKVPAILPPDTPESSKPLILSRHPTPPDLNLF